MDWLILVLVSFLAAVLQTVTGFGFGLFCVPIFLWVVDSIAAIHLVIIISLIMSLAIWPSVKGQMQPQLLTRFGIGCVIGSPVGIMAFGMLELSWLKLLVAVVIFFVTLWNAYLFFMPLISNRKNTKSPNEGNAVTQVGIGVASGVLATTIAMPAPLAMLYLSGTSYDKTVIRATILVFFILSYSIALVCQLTTQGIEIETWKTSAILSPVALLGVYIGHKLAPRVSVFYFKTIVFATLLITSISMLISVING